MEEAITQGSRTSRVANSAQNHVGEFLLIARTGAETTRHGLVPLQPGPVAFPDHKRSIEGGGRM